MVVPLFLPGTQSKNLITISHSFLVFLCVCGCIWYMYACVLGMFSQRPECLLPVVPYSIALRQASWLNLDLGQQPPAIFVSLPATALELAGPIARHGFSSECWAFELSSLCLPGKSSSHVSRFQGPSFLLFSLLLLFCCFSFLVCLSACLLLDRIFL